MTEPVYGQRPAVPPRRPRERPVCPTCLNQLRMTQDGWACPRHGLQDVKAAKK